MATLTFRERVMDGRTQLRRFFRLLSHQWFEGVHCAWVREYQERGAVHYHVLWDRSLLGEDSGAARFSVESVKRGGKPVEVLRGALERLIVDAWCSAVGDDHPDFLAFQRGGIVQRWIGADGASRYFGSYLAKQRQKELPSDAEKSGRWWWVCQEAKPVPTGTAFLTSYPFPIPLSTVFDKEKLMDHIQPSMPIYVPKWGNKPKQK